MAQAVVAQSFPAYAPLVRPPEAQYRVLSSAHFDVIYQEGLEDAARETAAILEAQLRPVQQTLRTGASLRMPVVLNGFNDRANGYVTPFPFKQEIEGVALKGNRITPHFPSWLWAVAPHELVHAVHADRPSGVGLHGLLRPFAPDLARAVNLWMPRGTAEGLAVYHESRIFPQAGRLNLPLFQMQYRAAMLSDDPWSLAQMLESPRYGRPGNRMYIGGAYAVAFWEEHYPGWTEALLDLHGRFPFFGHGVELWAATGRPPWRLGRELRAAGRRLEASRQAARAPFSQPHRVAQERGTAWRRPRWLADSVLVAYGEGYAVRPGWYRFDGATGERVALAHHRITEDVFYSLDPARQRLLFSRYVPDALAPVQALAEVFALDLETGETEQLTDGGRVLAPVAAAASVWAVRNSGPFTEWVALDGEAGARVLAAPPRTTILSVLPSPDGQAVAVLAGHGYTQGLYQALRNETPSGAESYRLVPWLVPADGAIYDASWTPDGRFLVFSMSRDEVANVFAWEPATDEVRQLTNVPFGALEPSVSPDGARLAFVTYAHEAYGLAVLPFAPQEAPLVEVERAESEDALSSGRLASADVLSEGDDAAVETRPYRASRYLRPRLAYPTAYYDGAVGEADRLGLGLGFAVQGTDPLERWLYAAEAFGQDGTGWGRAYVQTGRWPLRPYVSAYRLPSAALVRGADGTALPIRRDERGVGVGARLPVVLSGDAFASAATVALQAAWETETWTARSDGAVVRPASSRLTLTPGAQLAYRLQQNGRDLLPNTGWRASVEAVADVWDEAGTPRRAVLGRLVRYHSLAPRRHTGLLLAGRLLTQNRSAIYGLDAFVPRGTEDAVLGAGTFAQVGAQVVQPLRFIEDGLVVLPAYLHVLYAYGFAEHAWRLEGASDRSRYASVGAGLGLQLRLFYAFSFDVRAGVAYDPWAQRWAAVFR